MADSIEQKIITAIVARMQLIDGTGSYLTDIGKRCEDSRPNWDQNELPAISVFEGTVTTERELNDDDLVEATRVMPVMIKGFFERSDTAAEASAFARKSISDVYRAIKTDPLWKIGSPSVSLVAATREKSHGIEYAENTFEITGVQIEIEIIYFAEYFNMES